MRRDFLVRAFNVTWSPDVALMSSPLHLACSLPFFALVAIYVPYVASHLPTWISMLDLHGSQASVGLLRGSVDLSIAFQALWGVGCPLNVWYEPTLMLEKISPIVTVPILIEPGQWEFFYFCLILPLVFLIRLAQVKTFVFWSLHVSDHNLYLSISMQFPGIWSRYLMTIIPSFLQW